jgi:cytochrome c
MLSQRDSRIALGGMVALLVVAAAGAGLQYHREQVKVRDRAEAITGGSAARGQALFSAYGCGGCHSLTGVPQAHGQVGPPLDTIGARAMIAGKLDNTPDNLERWIRDPQSVTPGTAMPRMGVRADQARDLAAFLYTRS